MASSQVLLGGFFVTNGDMGTANGFSSGDVLKSEAVAAEIDT
jgi:hypothetical protein